MEWLYNFIEAQLENEFAAGGLFIVTFTAILALMRNVPGQLWYMVERSIITTVDVADHDQAFFWVNRWLGQQEYTLKRARWLTVSTRRSPFTDGPSEVVETVGSGEKKRRTTVEVVFSPAPGVHLLRHKGQFVTLWRTRREVESVSGGLAYHETFTFRALSRSVIKDIIEEARELAYPPEDDTISVFRDQYSSWRLAMRRAPRSIESVVLEGGIMEELLADLRWFFDRADWYKRHGIPYQRGYMIEGPPGNGKTSLVVAIASLFKRDIYIVRASGTSDEAFQAVMGEVPPHGIVLIEDVDCMWDERDSKSGNWMTFSGFINAIDGVAAPQGRVLFMTTNHVEKLDGALMRPGRADKKFHLDNATPDQARRLFLNFFPATRLLAGVTCEWPVREAAADRFAEAVDRLNGKGDEVSMATLQEHILINSGNFEEAADLFSEVEGRPGGNSSTG